MTGNAREIPANRSHILIVDDTPENLAVLARVLRDDGYDVRLVLSGKMALRAAQRERPGLMLLDVRMPDMDGWEVCRAFKQDPALSAIPIIFISAATDTEVKVKAFTSGGVDFISKPFETEEVLARVHTHLALHAAEQELEARLEARTADLRRASAYARSLIEADLDPMVIIGLDGLITDLNRAAERAIGCDRHHLIGTPFANAFAESEAARHGFERALVEASVRDLALTLSHREGGGIDALVHLTVFHDEAGTIQGVLASARDITERRRVETALRRTNRALKTLTTCNAALVHATDDRQLFEEMCRTIVDIGGYRLAWIGLVGSDGKTLRPAAWLGSGPESLDSIDLHDGPVVQAVRTGRLQVMQNAADDPRRCFSRPDAARLAAASTLALPLAGDGRVFGVLGIHSAASHAFDDEEILLLTELATDLAYGIAALRTRAAHERDLQRLENSMEATIQAIANTVEMRDPYTAGHQQRVAQLVIAIARELGLSEVESHGLYLASIVHDLGKIHIPAEILSKPSRLSRPEFELIKCHAAAGYELLRTIPFPWPIAEIVHQHHERLDGSGYPQGLAGSAILLEARIIAVADVVEAMASHRPYRPALGIEPALAEIIQHQGTLYDSEVVAVCLRLFREQNFRFT
jgi:PAS domain S-box-containing protein